MDFGAGGKGHSDTTKWMIRSKQDHTSARPWHTGESLRIENIESKRSLTVIQNPENTWKHNATINRYRIGLSRQLRCYNGISTWQLWQENTRIKKTYKLQVHKLSFAGDSRMRSSSPKAYVSRSSFHVDSSANVALFEHGVSLESVVYHHHFAQLNQLLSGNWWSTIGE